MLEEKFYISSKKIRVLHNGINISAQCTKKKSKHDSSPLFHIGFLGRLDTPKGVHVLIDAMHYLVDSGIKLTIAGDGALEDVLKEQADDLENVFFIGRIEEPYSFFSDIDLLVVPSIREPLGNVCLEAGLCKVPVLATNIDGIPEIIENKVSGELIDPTIEVLINYPDGFIPLPEFVINPVTRQLCTPKQVDPSLLARKIIELSTEPEKLTGYADKLHEKVINYFNINRYCIELNAIYREIYFS
jgi:glycosyltransferase involved in cell wall biosynthesis